MSLLLLTVKSASAKDTSVSNKKYVARRSIISHSVSLCKSQSAMDLLHTPTDVLTIMLKDFIITAGRPAWALAV